MSEWAAKRFWTAAETTDTGDGHGVALDGRTVRTPAKAPLKVPTRALAQAIASEWDAVEERIDPGAMPMTRAANAAIDKVTPQHAAVAEAIAAYGETDLLCYRADSPQELVLRQAEEWDPLLDWADSALGARLQPVAGVMPVQQDAAALHSLSARVHVQDAFALTALYDLTALSGSLVIGLAALEGAQDFETLWNASRVDEAWQAEVWGADAEAEAEAAIKRAAFLNAGRFFLLAGDRTG